MTKKEKYCPYKSWIKRTEDVPEVKMSKPRKSMVNSPIKCVIKVKSL
ncbi:hypothetical protein CPTAKMNP4_038 [Salmonella phage vB_SenM-AKM_NP4]|uniref:Uncharacterized protein n=1 Tax=Salmonella phage S16 TaxID=1087482 RepID=M1HEX5_BPS16|nr:hypothetical protein I133_gp233 [Salmonella phage vB_SenM-S16]AGE48148.1 hypothetical protein [Salmonella phage vB_SenM-S16]WDR21704.1 hypothetical protein PJM34_0036 [Salmonella phage vB_SenM_UTK0003]WLI71663.1 hypothetical protein CPTAKMNP4_038 [Salmonella phage vB_SenM-AKM_NP4]